MMQQENKSQLTPLESEAKQHANLSKGRAQNLSRKRVNIPKLHLILHELYQGATPHEIMQVTGVSNQALKRLITSLRNPPSTRILRIISWELIGMTYQPVYKIGEGADSPKPKPLTGAQKSKRFRDRQKHRLLTAAFSTISSN